MTERDYEGMLDAVKDAINPAGEGPIAMQPSDIPPAANDNSVEWPLTPFPEGWHASP